MKRMLFNATQAEELRVAIVDGQKLIEHVRQTPKFAPCSICFSRPRDLECRSNYSTGAASRNV